MRKIVLLSLAVALTISVISLAQDTMKQGGDKGKSDDMKAEKASSKAVHITGKISADGQTFVSDKDSKNWTISNPEAVKGHEGHHVTLTGQPDAAKNEIKVMSLKMGKGEVKNTTKKDDMPK